MWPWPLTLKFNKVLEAVEIHVHAKFHQAKLWARRRATWLIRPSALLRHNVEYANVCFSASSTSVSHWLMLRQDSEWWPQILMLGLRSANPNAIPNPNSTWYTYVHLLLICTPLSHLLLIFFIGFLHIYTLHLTTFFKIKNVEKKWKKNVKKCKKNVTWIKKVKYVYYIYDIH